MSNRDYQDALILRTVFNTLQVRARRLRQANPSMEQAQTLLELIGAYAGVSPASDVVSVESLETPEEILDKAVANLDKAQVTLEWFFSKTKEAKTNPSGPTPQQAMKEKEMFENLTKCYSNHAWLRKATMDTKPTILSGTLGGVLSFNERGLSVDETIKKLNDEVRNIAAFIKHAEVIYPKWVKWADSVNEAVEVEWEKHKDEDEIPSITTAVRKLHPLQPTTPTKKFDLDKIIVLGMARNPQWVDKRSGALPSDLPIPEVIIDFDPLTQDQVFKLATLALQHYALSEELFRLEEEIVESGNIVGFDDPPYRADAVKAAINDFGWNKANWDAHNKFNETQLITLLEDCSYRKFKAIHSWLYNAVVDRP